MVVKGLPRVGRLWDLSSEGVAVTGQMEVRLPGTQGAGCLPASMVGASTFMTPICPGLGWLASDKVSLSPEYRTYEYRTQPLKSCLKCSSCPLCCTLELHTGEQHRSGLLLPPHPETTSWTMWL